MARFKSEIREFVEQRAKLRCEYCLMPDSPLAAYSHQIDYIKPIKHRGSDELENLALACLNCNLAKGSDLAAEDPKTGKLSYFFNPRNQVWSEHFYLDGAFIRPLSIEARVTELIFRLNEPERLLERKIFQAVGLYLEN